MCLNLYYLLAQVSELSSLSFPPCVEFWRLPQILCGASLCENHCFSSESPHPYPFCECMLELFIQMKILLKQDWSTLESGLTVL